MFFNQFVNHKTKEDFIGRVIINGSTGSSWRINFLELDFFENEADKNFLDDDQELQDTSLKFCRKFHSQSREMSPALNNRSNANCKLDTHDLQPEIYWETERSFVQSDQFNVYKKAAEKFKKSLCSFEVNSKDSFYDAIFYSLTSNLSQNKKIISNGIFSNNVLEKLRNIIFEREVIHHSYITGKVIGYAHIFCNQKGRDNKNQINVIACSMFGFDFFFLLKRSKARSLANNKAIYRWIKPNKYTFCKHNKQANFMDTMKYY